MGLQEKWLTVCYPIQPTCPVSDHFLWVRSSFQTSECQMYSKKQSWPLFCTKNFHLILHLCDWNKSLCQFHSLVLLLCKLFMELYCICLGVFYKQGPTDYKERVRENLPLVARYPMGIISRNWDIICFTWLSCDQALTDSAFLMRCLICQPLGWQLLFYFFTVRDKLYQSYMFSSIILRVYFIIFRFPS